MKNSIYTLYILVLFNLGFAVDPQAPAVEIFIGTENVSPTDKRINIYLNAAGQVWGYDNQVYILTNQYDNSLWIPYPNNELLTNGWDGWDFVTSQNNGGTYPVYAYGLYKISTDESNAYFYLDFRDYRIGFYGNYQPPSYGHNIDIWVKYNDTTNEFYISTQPTFGWSDPIINGELLFFWDIKQKGNPYTNQFPQYWSKCLNLIEKNNRNPRLVWGPHPNMSGITHYKIYRAVTDYGDPPPSPVFFSLLETVSSSTFDYTDTDFLLGGSVNTAHWFVKAYNSSLSTATNTVSTDVQYYNKSKTEQIHTIKKTSTFQLITNFPNPFNAVTQIRYSILQDAQVELFVYDIQGKQVYGESVYKTQGEHVFSFEASSLPSGIYFYGISAGQRMAIKRMLLIK